MALIENMTRRRKYAIVSVDASEIGIVEISWLVKMIEKHYTEERASGIRHPASGIRHPASGIRHPASGIRHPASGIRQ
jgi:hypothetical protein